MNNHHTPIILRKETINFYKGMEKDLKTDFLFQQPVYKPFGSIEEQNHWISQTSFADVEDLVNVNVPDERYSNYIHNKYGGFETFRSGYLNLPVNVYIIPNKKGNVYGLSLGFNIIKSKSN